MNAGADPLVKVRRSEEELGLPEAPDALRQAEKCIGKPEGGAYRGQVLSEAHRAPAFAQQYRRVVHYQAGLSGNQFLGARLLDREQNRCGISPRHAALVERVGYPLGDNRLTGYDGVMHRVVECDAAIAISLFAKAPEDLERQLVALAERVRNFLRDRSQDPRDDRPSHRDKCTHLVRDRILLPIFPDFHAGQCSAGAAARTWGCTLLIRADRPVQSRFADKIIATR